MGAIIPRKRGQSAYSASNVIRMEFLETEQTRPLLPGRPLMGVAAALMLPVLILAAAPASAASGKADHLPEFSACVGPALEPYGFTDTDGIVAEQAVNCLVHYRITQGKTPFAFVPDETVTRRQMALFLTRAARIAGIRMSDALEDQGFADVEGLSEETRDAVNRMAQLEIMTGVSGNRFDPQGRVSRQEMAVFLARFLALAEVGEGGTPIVTVVSDETLFADVSGLPRGVENAVYQLYEMGVTEGTTDTTFSPDGSVTRAQMASYITRALAHTNARPSGVTVQTADDVVVQGEQADVLISLRDRFHRPIRDAYVDLFSVDLDTDGAFDRDGSCSTTIKNRPAPLGGRTCAIDVADSLTDPFGNAVDSLQVDEDLTLWAWTGGLGDEYDRGDVEARTFPVRTSKPPAELEVTDDMEEDAELLAFGDSITFTLQVVDRDGDPVSVVRTVRIDVTTEVNGVVRESESRTYRTDSSGRETFTYRERDPDRSDDDDVIILDFEVEVLTSDLTVRDETTLGERDGGGFRATWSQEAPEPFALRLIQKPLFHVASDQDRGAVNSVQALLIDQYGNPVRRRQILFSSQDEQGLGEDRFRRQTNSRGIATARYQRDSRYTGVEEINAEVEGEDIEADPVIHYWVKGYATGPERGLFILDADYERNQFVTSDLSAYAYDRNDRFRINGAPATLQEFEDAIERGLDTVDVDISSLDASSVNRFDLRA